MVIRLKHRPQNEQLVWALFLAPFLLAPCMQFAHIPGVIKYVFDAVWALLLLTMVFKRKREIGNAASFLLLWIISFFTITFVNYIVHFQSPLYYLWGFRNNFRGYVLFFATIFYFDSDNVEEALNLLDKLFFLNAVLMFIQFFGFGYKQDNLGGIFGVESGCNGYLNVFFCIMTATNYIQYCNGKKPFKAAALNMVLMLVLAAMSELKFYYVEFVIFIAAGTLITKFSWKKLSAVLAGAVALVIGFNVFLAVFPDIDLSVAGLYQYASNTKGYTSSGDLNRLGFFSQVNGSLLPTLWDQIFGLGLGNCDYATGIDVLTSPFSQQYQQLHYGWMSTTFMYLENGLIGLIFFFGFFVLIFLMSIRMKKSGADIVYCQIAELCAIAAVLNGVYNISLRVESGYMMYFMLAIPWCVARRRVNSNMKGMNLYSGY